MKFKSQGAALSGIGLLLVGLAIWFAFVRGWEYGAKATLSGVFGISYLLVGVVVLSTDSATQLFRRTIFSLPIAYIGVFVALQSAHLLAYNSISPTVDTAIRALWVTLLGYPVGMGYVYKRSTTTGTGQGVLLAAFTSIFVGSVIGSVVWTDIWPASLGMRFLLLFTVAFGLVVLGALPSYLIPTSFDRSTTA